VKPDDSYYRQLDGLWLQAVGGAVAALPPPPYRNAVASAEPQTRKPRSDSPVRKNGLVEPAGAASPAA
jgi:hypothetical protein